MNSNGIGQQSPIAVMGTSQNDTLNDTIGATNVFAGGGDDTIVAHAEYVASGYDAFGAPSLFNGTVADIFNGGAGTDTIDYSLVVRMTVAHAPGFPAMFGGHYGVHVNLAEGVAHRIMSPGVHVQPDGLISIENVIGSQRHDTILGDDGANVLQGLGGNDTIRGRGGNDTILGGDGNDNLWGDDGNDTLWGGTGNDVIRGGIGNDTAYGGSGDDTVWGGRGNDTLYGEDGNDFIDGGLGDDTLFGGKGDDHLSGGGGTDTGLWVINSPVLVNMLTGTVQSAHGSDTIVGIENVKTGSASDVVLADEEDNRIETGAGHDVVYANGGNDTVYGAGGNDKLYGYDGNDKLYGESGNDELWGMDGSDYLSGGDGDDKLVGGDGNDTLLGGNHNDHLRGGAGDDIINVGNGGTDVVQWQAGDLGLDTIYLFTLGQDKLSFGTGFLAAGDVEDNLLVFLDGGSAWLAANTADAGWEFLAEFVGVNGIALGNAIDDGSIFDVQVGVLGGGAAGDYNLGGGIDPFA